MGESLNKKPGIQIPVQREKKKRKTLGFWSLYFKQIIISEVFINLYS
jgi:hypothetical protein